MAKLFASRINLSNLPTPTPPKQDINQGGPTSPSYIKSAGVQMPNNMTGTTNTMKYKDTVSLGNRFKQPTFGSTTGLQEYIFSDVNTGYITIRNPKVIQQLSRVTVQKNYYSTVNVNQGGPTTPVNNQRAEIAIPNNNEGTTNTARYRDQVSMADRFKQPTLGFTTGLPEYIFSDKNTGYLTIKSPKVVEKLSAVQVQRVDYTNTVFKQGGVLNLFKNIVSRVTPNIQFAATSYLTLPNTKVKVLKGDELITNPNTVINKIEPGDRITNPDTKVVRIKAGDRIVDPKTAIQPIKAGDRIINPNTKITKIVPGDRITDPNTKVVKIEPGDRIINPNIQINKIKPGDRITDPKTQINKIEPGDRITNPEIKIKPITPGDRIVDPKTQIKEIKADELITNPDVKINKIEPGDRITDPNIQIVPIRPGDRIVDPQIRIKPIEPGDRITDPKVEIQPIEPGDRITDPETRIKKLTGDELITDPRTQVKKIKPDELITDPKTVIKKLTGDELITDPNTKIKKIKPDELITDPQTVVNRIRPGDRITDPQTVIKKLEPDELITDPRTVIRPIQPGDRIINPNTVIIPIQPGDRIIDPNLTPELLESSEFAVQSTDYVARAIKGDNPTGNAAFDGKGMNAYNHIQTLSGEDPNQSLLTRRGQNMETFVNTTAKWLSRYGDPDLPGGFKTLNYDEIQARRNDPGRARTDFVVELGLNKKPPIDNYEQRLGMPANGKDTINNSVNATANDLVKLKIASTRDGVALQFRSYITAFSDNYTANYTDVNYIGRPDTMKIYKGVTRAISLGFKIPLFSEEEVDTVYAKLERLVQIGVMGAVSSGGLVGPFLKLTLGGWLHNTPVIINSLKYDTNPLEYSWDIDKEVPQVVDVSMDFVALADNSGAMTTSVGKYIKAGSR